MKKRKRFTEGTEMKKIKKAEDSKYAEVSFRTYIGVRDTIEERASYIKRYTKEELETSKGKGWEDDGDREVR
jgi:hypothetical protein